VWQLGDHGLEWIVEGHGCLAAKLQDAGLLRQIFSEIIADLDLHPVGETLWHQFPNTGGITGLALLSESHLACHTFPEHQSLCLNVFSCLPRRRWEFEERLRALLGAEQVRVRCLTRGILE